jgi:AAA domain
MPRAEMPLEMQARAQWLLAGPDATGAFKVPMTVDTEGNTRLCNTDRSGWLPYDVARAEAEARGFGFGYCIADDDPFACIDLDVKDDTTQADLNRYWALVQMFDSYTEFSQSGKGLHVWVRGKVGVGKRLDGVEIYSQARFIACTGRALINRPIAERQELLVKVHAAMKRGDKPHVALETVESDDTDWSVAANALDADGNPKGNLMGRLFSCTIHEDDKAAWQAMGFPSQSEADLALIKAFGRITKSNKACWGAFLLSKLGQRDKAERADYRRWTLAEARTHLANDELMIAHGKQIADALWPIAQALTLQPAPAMPVAQWGSAFSPHFKLLDDDDLMRMPEAQWIVKGVIPAQGIGAVYGPSGTFKSFLNLDLLASVSNGFWWFGLRTLARPVVYVPFEGKSGVPNRVKAWRKSNPDRTSGIAFIYEGMNLRNPLDRAKLIKTLKERGWAGGVLCIDTLAQSGPGIEENSSEGMGEMIAVFQELQAQLGGVVLVVHHTGKDVSRGLRGWSGLLGALDFAIECEVPDNSPPRTAKFSLAKVKDGEAGRSFDFEMQIMFLGHDSDGDEITSLAVRPKVRVAITPVVQAKNDEDDNFIWDWANKLFLAGEHPSGRALLGYIDEMKLKRAFTQKSIADAVARLKSAGRFVTEEERGNPWLRPIELTSTVPGAAKP